MARSRAETERLDRLAGDEKGSGGGLPLPDLFSAFLVDLLDNGPALRERFTQLAEKSLEYKAARVMNVWGSWDALAEDVLQQMAAREIVTDESGTWSLGEQFEPGKNLSIVPKRAGKNRNPIGVTVFDKEEREAREASSDARMTITELVGKLRPEGPGIRSVDAAQVEQIRASRAAGVPPLYRVLVDSNGHVLDGKHRLAADPDWPKLTLNIHDDTQALAVARAANMGRPLPGKVAALIDRVLGDARAAKAAQQARILAALAQYPDDTHNQIGVRLGYASGNRQIGEVCLKQTSPCRHGLSGPGSRRGPGGDVPAAQPKQRPVPKWQNPAMVAEIKDLLAGGQIPRQDEIGKKYGCSSETVNKAIAVERALWDAGHGAEPAHSGLTAATPSVADAIDGDYIPVPEAPGADGDITQAAIEQILAGIRSLAASYRREIAAQLLIEMSETDRIAVLSMIGVKT